MRRNIALLLVLVFLAASCLVAAKPALSSADVTEDTWVSKAPMQQARAGLGVAVVNGKIYAIGGSTASGQYPPDAFAGGFVGTNEEYDTAMDTWTFKASMPTPRAHFAIAAYQNKIYCIGGAVGFTAVEGKPGFYSYITSGVNEVYDTVTDTWETRAPLPDDAMKFQAHVVNGKIYVMDWSYTYVYDPADDSWSLKKQMPSPSLLSSLVSAVVDDKIIVTGVFSYTTFEEQRIMIYDTETDNWSQGSTGPTLVFESAAEATKSAKAPKRVYVLSLKGNHVYDPMADSWSTATPMPTPRMNFAVAVVDDVLYVIGGYAYTRNRYDYISPIAVSEQYFPLGYGVPPEIKIVSPANQTYNASSIALVFAVNKSALWLGYSLDGQANVTIAGNTTLNKVPNGAHNLTVYATDQYGNTGASKTVYFTVEAPEPFPAVPIAAASGVAFASAAVCLFYYRKKRNH